MANRPDPTSDHAAAQARREAAHAQAAAASRGNRNIQILAGTVFLALVVVVLVIVISGGGDKPAPSPEQTGTVKGTTPTAALLDGIPQQGFTLGNTKTAKVNIIEFLDVQCPFCRDHQLDQNPTVIDDLVKTGQATLTMQPVAALGEDSATGRIALANVAGKNEAWTFLNLWYWNQPTENTGYVTPGYLASLAKATPNITVADASTTPTAGAKAALAEVDRAAKALKVTQVPTFAIGMPGADYSTYTVIDQNATSKPAGQQIVDDVRKAIAAG